MKVTKHDEDNYIVLKKIIAANSDKNDMLLVKTDDGSLSFAHGVVENENGVTWDNKVDFQEEVENLQREQRHRKR